MREVRVKLPRVVIPPPLDPEERASVYRCAARPSPRLGAVWNALKAAGPGGLTRNEIQRMTGVRGIGEAVSELRLRWDVPVRASSAGRNGSIWEWRYWIEETKGRKS